jgi:hypothetical protein
MVETDAYLGGNNQQLAIIIMRVVAPQEIYHIGPLEYLTPARELEYSAQLFEDDLKWLQTPDE